MFLFTLDFVYRESWGSNLRCVFFLLGYSANQTINQLAQSEMTRNKDILQIPIIDKYNHLTEKVEYIPLCCEI